MHQKDGGLDDLISSIRSGKAFGDKESITRKRRVRGDTILKGESEGPIKLEKLFQNQDQGAVGRLRRQDPIQEREKNDSLIKLKKLLGEYNLQ